MPKESEDNVDPQVVRIDRLKSLCNPYRGCWLDIESPIRLDEIALCLARGDERLTDTALVLWDIPDDARLKHIQKIAYFVRNGFTDPISIDIGFPAMGCCIDHIIEDGNHRFASAIYRSDVLNDDNEIVPIIFCGDIDYANELELFSSTKEGSLEYATFDFDIDDIPLSFCFYDESGDQKSVPCVLNTKSGELEFTDQCLPGVTNDCLIEGVNGDSYNAFIPDGRNKYVVSPVDFVRNNDIQLTA